MKLNFDSITSRFDLVAFPAKQLAENWQGNTPIENIQVAEINPKYMGGVEFCKHYDISQDKGANCVIIEAVRGEKKTLAACLISVECKQADFNGVVRRYLNARRVSLAPIDKVLRETNMEYGSITVFGLPESWPILIDPSVISQERVVIGTGLQKSKMSLPGKMLLEIPNTQMLEGLCKK